MTWFDPEGPVSLSDPVVRSDQLLKETSGEDRWNRSCNDSIGLLHWFPAATDPTARLSQRADRGLWRPSEPPQTHHWKKTPLVSINQVGRFLHMYPVNVIDHVQTIKLGQLKPLSSTWPTYDTKSRSSTLSNAYILNVLTCSLDWLFRFQCVIKGAWSSKLRENRSTYKRQRRAFKKGINQENSGLSHVPLRMGSIRRKVGYLSRISNLNAEMILFILVLRPVSSLTAKNDNIQQPVYFAPGIIGLYTKFHCSFNANDQIS